jgi:predicted Zn-dependent protease
MSRSGDNYAVAPAAERPRMLSEADCHDVLQRLERFSTGGGYTGVWITSVWTGNVRWARNQVNTSGETCDNSIVVKRYINGSRDEVRINDTSDAALVAAARRAERLTEFRPSKQYDEFVPRLPLEPTLKPQLFSDATYQLNAEHRAAVALELTKDAQAAGMLSAGYIEVAAVAIASLDTAGRVRYFPYTQARYSVTVRDPQGTGSGWAGVDWYDWGKIDANALTHRALDKCLQSRNPVRVEPGRYTTILEPQAVADLVWPLMDPMSNAMSRNYNESRNSPIGPFLKIPETQTEPGYSKLGERIIDERITISADPMDPEMGFPPFQLQGGGVDTFAYPVFHPATWFDHGVLTQLGYDRTYAMSLLQKNEGLPNSGAFRMSGGTTSIDEMIATTKRGLLVTRFDRVILVDLTSQLYRGYTRDGLWLIENGKITHAAKNLVFTESSLFALNRVEQLGVPQRVFHPCTSWKYSTPQPVVVPALRVSDFSFTALSDAV